MSSQNEKKKIRAMNRAFMMSKFFEPGVYEEIIDSYSNGTFDEEKLSEALTNAGVDNPSLVNIIVQVQNLYNTVEGPPFRIWWYPRPNLAQLHDIIPEYSES
jgi:hypothetical protein